MLKLLGVVTFLLPMAIVGALLPAPGESELWNVAAFFVSPIVLMVMWAFYMYFAHALTEAESRLKKEKEK